MNLSHIAAHIRLYKGDDKTVEDKNDEQESDQDDAAAAAGDDDDDDDYDDTRFDYIDGSYLLPSIGEDYFARCVFHLYSSHHR